jgi:hypothetical protein
MSDLLNYPPYSPRDDALFLKEINDLTRCHLDGCPEYSRIWPDWKPTGRIEDVPYLHVELFKHLDLRNQRAGIEYGRTLKSSATTSGVFSRIALDSESSRLQSQSSEAIFKDFLGKEKCPLLILDSTRSLLSKNEISARVAAAMSLRPLADDICFLLEKAEDPSSMNWKMLEDILKKHDRILVYGFTWMLWSAWADAKKPEHIVHALKDKTILFVHSGGWKKLEAKKVNMDLFNETLLRSLSSESKVIDFYGLVEQVGIVYPLCQSGYRHVPLWAAVIVRDPYSLESLGNESGQLQLLNTLALGGPYHSVLTEDTGRLISGQCQCGRSGQHFELLGRIPKAKIRGCANV